MKTKKEIINFINSFTKKISRIELNKIINGMGMTYSSDEELYMWLHDIVDPPTCLQCGGSTKMINLKKGFQNFCSPSCGSKSDISKEKIKQTSLERYGVDSPNKCEEKKKLTKKVMMERYGAEHNLQISSCKEKVKQTMIERYGVEHYSQSDEFNKKTKQTSLEKYGVEHYSQSDEFNKKAKQTSLEKYGVEYYSQTDSCKEKAKQTSLEKYGVEYYSQTDSCKEKTKQTSLEKYGVVSPNKYEAKKELTKKTVLEKYGVENVFQLEKIQLIIKERNLEKYGVEYASQKHLTPEAIVLLKNIDYLILQNKEKSLSQIAFDLGVHPSTISNILIKNNIELKRHNSSLGQEELELFLDSLGLNFIINNRTIINPYELDIYLPEYNLAIEYCGLYWHSDIKKNNNYHSNKLKLCNEKGIRLITIFEDEWIFNKETCKTVLKHILHINHNNKIYARKCNIKQIEYDEYKEFIKNHHLQQQCGSIQIAYALEHQNIIVAVMSFKKIKSALNSYELIRFCTNGNTVVGAASKLLNHFEANNQVDLLQTFADLRWSDGELYKILGFTKDIFIPPDYSYIKNLKRYHKFGFRKNKIAKKFGVIIDGKTETQLMNELGYNKIYDCGKIKFIKKY